MGELKAKLIDARASIADLQDRLAMSQCKESRLRHDLSEARSERAKALVSTTGKSSSATTSSRRSASISMVATVLASS